MGAKNYSNEFLCPDLHAACTSLAAMAARATRSASRKARATEAVATGPLGALSHDELGVIFDGLADPLQPVVAVALSSTCLGLRTPLGLALQVLKEQHENATALCHKLEVSCTDLAGHSGAIELAGLDVAEHMGTLGMLLQGHRLPKLEQLAVSYAGDLFGDAGVRTLFEGLGPCAVPSLRLMLDGNHIGKVGAETLAAALGRGAMPKLEKLNIECNPIGNQGVAALAAPLRKMPALKVLRLDDCEFGDEGVASLFANLGKDDFKALQQLYLDEEIADVTEKGCATIATAIESGAMPELLIAYATNDVSQQVVDDAVQRFRFEPRVEAMLRADSSDGEEPYLHHLTIKSIFEKLERASGLPANGGMPANSFRRRGPMIRSATENMLRKLNLLTIPHG